MNGYALVRFLMMALGILALMACGERPIDVEALKSKPKGYVGSDTSKMCHLEHYDSWKMTLHSRMMQNAQKNRGAIIVPDLDEKHIRAEALLAMLYIFIIHFTIGHFRRGMFPMNECMFAGSVELEKEMEKKPLWIARLQEDGRLEEALSQGRRAGTAPFISSSVTRPWPWAFICCSTSSFTGIILNGIDGRELANFPEQF